MTTQAKSNTAAIGLIFFILGIALMIGSSGLDEIFVIGLFLFIVAIIMGVVGVMWSIAGTAEKTFRRFTEGDN